jgi:hypothetical protein
MLCWHCIIISSKGIKQRRGVGVILCKLMLAFVLLFVTSAVGSKCMIT